MRCMHYPAKRIYIVVVVFLGEHYVISMISLMSSWSGVKNTVGEKDWRRDVSSDDDGRNILRTLLLLSLDGPTLLVVVVRSDG